MAPHKTVTKCRCCGGGRLHKYLDLGDQPLANNYHDGTKTLQTFPLQVFRCGDCSHSQLGVVVSPELMYENYLYVSGTPDTFRKYCQYFAADVCLRFQHLPTVLDVACNDGTLLECFRGFGCEVYGVDPAKNLRPITRAKNIDVATEYWGTGLDLGRSFDVITGTNVFAHVDDVYGFLRDAERHLAKRGLLILEFPYCREMIARCEFDTVYHEHLSYFLARPFRLLAERSGFSVAAVMRTPIHGGSVRFFLARHDDDKVYGIKHTVAEMEREEQELSDKVYDDFQGRVDERRRELESMLGGRKVVGYGASAKGNTMMNYFGLKPEYVVDDNPMKWGLLTPGANAPIAPPSRLSGESDKPLDIVLFAWNFADEIKAKVKKLRPNVRDNFFYYSPSVMQETL